MSPSCSRRSRRPGRVEDSSSSPSLSSLSRRPSPGPRCRLRSRRGWTSSASPAASAISSVASTVSVGVLRRACCCLFGGLSRRFVSWRRSRGRRLDVVHVGLGLVCPVHGITSLVSPSSLLGWFGGSSAGGCRAAADRPAEGRPAGPSQRVRAAGSLVAGPLPALLAGQLLGLLALRGTGRLRRGLGDRVPGAVDRWQALALRFSSSRCCLARKASVLGAGLLRIT